MNEEQKFPLFVKQAKWKMRLAVVIMLVAIISLAIAFGMLGPELLWPIVSISLLLTFGVIWLYISSLKRVLLYVDEENGLTANAASKKAIGPVAWTDIRDIRVENHSAGQSSQAYLTVLVADTSKYLPDEEHPLRKPWRNLQAYFGYGDEQAIFMVPLNGADINREKLLEILIKTWKSKQVESPVQSLEQNPLISVEASSVGQERKRFPRWARIVTSLIVLVAGGFFLFGGNQLGRSPLYDNTSYVVTDKGSSVFRFAFSISDNHVRDAYVAWAKEGYSASNSDISRIVKVLDDSAPIGDKVASSEMESGDTVFDTGIKTSRIWESNFTISFEFADNKYYKLSDFKKTSSTSFTALLRNETGDSLDVTVKKEN